MPSGLVEIDGLIFLMTIVIYWGEHVDIIFVADASIRIFAVKVLTIFPAIVHFLYSQLLLHLQQTLLLVYEQWHTVLTGLWLCARRCRAASLLD